ncbi:MAG: zf-HC2 domain-containing protein [Candidatus Aadella gelida]|nr:zf-HC2 domain-containing protein [Candidatus Aadella gelida]
MNRMCPSEKALSEYLADFLPAKEKDKIEEHLVKCSACRDLLFEAHIVTNKFDIKYFSRKVFSSFKKNFFLILFFLSLTLSFLLPNHFLQLLIVTVITGIKWATDSRTDKILIMVHKAMKSGDSDELSDSMQDHFNKE